MLVVFGVPPCLLLMVGNTGLVHQDGAEDDEPDELCQTTSIWQKVSTTTDEYSGRGSCELQTAAEGVRGYLSKPPI